MKLALSGFLFEDNYVSQSLDLEAFLALARSTGYEGVELRDTQVKPDSPVSRKREILRLIRAEGLVITCLTARHLPQSGVQRDTFFASYLELCRDLHCGLLKISSDTAWLREAAERARPYGVTLATNNHVGGQLETTTGTRAYFAEIRHPNMGLLYDALHLCAAGQDYAGFISECLPLTRNILIHSLRPAGPVETVILERAGKKWTLALPDEPGVQPDWQAVMTRFKDQGYREWITVIEHGWPVARRASVAQHCAAVIRRFWDQAEVLAS